MVYGIKSLADVHHTDRGATSRLATFELDCDPGSNRKESGCAGVKGRKAVLRSMFGTGSSHIRKE
jgi:hypothetical protein